MDRGEWVSLGVGVLAGAVVALLLAPQSGKETRAYLKKKIGEKISCIRGNCSEENDNEEITSA